MNRNNLITCDQCGGSLEVDPNKEIIKCEFCGACYSVSGILSESDEIVLERIRRDVELGRQNLEAERIRQENANALRRETNERTEQFKKSKLRKASLILACIFLLSCVGGISNHNPLMSIIAGIQAILFFSTFILGMQIIPEKTQNFHILPFILALVLIIPLGLSRNACVIEEKEIFSPNEIVLIDMIPDLDSNSGHIWHNTKAELRLDVYNIPIKKYYSYVESCKEMGYATKIEEGDESFKALNQEGFEINLRYYTIRNGEISITLQVPDKTNNLVLQ